MLAETGFGLIFGRGIGVTQRLAEPEQPADLIATYFVTAYLGSTIPTLALSALNHAVPARAHTSSLKDSIVNHSSTITDPGSVAAVPDLPAGFGKRFSSSIVDNGRVRLHIVSGGTGPALLLLAGWPQTWYAWRRVMPALAEQFTVIAAEPRGVGLSEKPAFGYDTGSLARDMVDLMAQLGHGRFTMVGHDIGMWTAYALAADHPNVLDRMVVAEAAIPGLSPSAPIFSIDLVNSKLWHFGFNRLPSLNEMLVRGHEYVFFSERFRTKAARPDAIPENAIIEYVAAITREPAGLRSSFEFYRALEITMAQNSERQRAPITLPVLAIGGAQGLGESVGTTMRLAGTDVTTLVIDDCGHYPAEENPDAMVEAISAFR